MKPTRLPAPEMLLLTPHDEYSMAHLIERHINFVKTDKVEALTRSARMPTICGTRSGRQGNPIASDGHETPPPIKKRLQRAAQAAGRPPEKASCGGIQVGRLATCGLRFSSYRAG